MRKNHAQSVLLNCKTKILIAVLLFLGMQTYVNAQSVGINTLSPDASAALDIQSTTGGLLIPRMTTAEISALVNPADGLLVYNTELENTMMFVQGAPFELYNKIMTQAITILSGITPVVWAEVLWTSPIELLGLDIHRFQMDLSNVEQVRVVANATGVTLPIGGTLEIALQYSTNNGATWNYLNSATFGPELSISINGLITTNWTDIDAAAKQDVQLRLVGSSSSTVATIQVGLGLVMVELR